jgi:glycosyltransferase involved in cell wall biosynthesis
LFADWSHIFGWLARLVSRDNSVGQAKLFLWKRLHGGSRAMSTCDVILAVWNGQNYLPAMLDSLLSQTTSDFNVLVRDDGSTDGSLEILQNYKSKFDGRLSVIAGEPTRSATANFAILMRETKADYVLFADQDDVWKPEKVGLTLISEGGRSKVWQVNAYLLCDRHRGGQQRPRGD